ncbi:MAG: AAA family ATPase [Betaproteobacteria bacterium]|nr:AAA family ATPase [Betaproteobacteria bacterium]
MTRSIYPPLVEALREPTRYPHAVDRVKVMETHISYVLLAGDFAYKIKKPVNLGFLDFRSLDRRRHYCDEELRINRRTAPDLYLDVIPITGTPGAPHLGGTGEPIEFAVKMRRFSQSCLLDVVTRHGGLDREMVTSLARRVAGLHASVAVAPADSAWARPETVKAQAEANLTEIVRRVVDDQLSARVAFLQAWTSREFARVSRHMEERRRGGFVRECHGDLHLGNVAWLDDQPVPFDGIEFNDELRWIDVMSEIAFLVMDLLDHDVPALAWDCLNAYLEATGDYGGVDVLRFYLVYRALVRAKVAAIRAGQIGNPRQDGDPVAHHVRLADRIARSTACGVMIMHGVSGSGKTTIAGTLVETLGAVRVRSDVERKRMHGLDANVGSGSAIAGGIYDPEQTVRVYERLATLARSVVAARWPVIVDATFLRRDERTLLREVARKAAVPFRIVACKAPVEVLEDRVRSRANDASEATVEVLHRQMAQREPLEPGERALVVPVDSADLGAAIAALQAALSPGKV